MVETMGSRTESGDKTQEVEKRALLKESEYLEISKKLEGLGAELTKKVNIKDIYFCPVNVASFAEIEMDSVGSYSLRLREQKNGNNEEVTLNVNNSLNILLTFPASFSLITMSISSGDRSIPCKRDNINRAEINVLYVNLFC